MASAESLWFEMGVRDRVSNSLANILAQAESIQDAMENFKIPMAAINNAAELERSLTQISVAKQRISETKGLTTDPSELARLKEMDRTLDKMAKKFEKFSEMKGTNLENMGVKGMAKFLEERENLSLAIDQVRRYTGEISAQYKEDERNKIAEAKNLDNLKDKYYELYRIRKELQDAVLNAAPGADVTEAMNMLQTLAPRIAGLARAINKNGTMPSNVIGADNEELFRRVKEETRSLNTETEKYNRTLNTTEAIQASLNKLELDTISQKKIAGIKKQTYEYTALEQKLREIQDLVRRVDAEKAGLGNGSITKPTYTREAINMELDAIQRRYNEAIAVGRQREKDDAEAKNKKADSSRKAAEAIQLLAHANQNLMSSYTRVAEAGQKANNVSIQLQQQIGQFASLYGIERILKSVVTIGGQFEYQHVALQNILGDIQQANTLFAQLQDLAIESPKTFMELTAYTKQLSAYQIPYNELFDTTKRLADLSAGLGVDMSRLILADGQVRSAAVLRGQELRQFTEAGIPLVQKLADEFTKLNGKAVTTGEVFELISKRAVPFEMVKKILWDMTSEGGQFYNMQAELADTLYGKWQKLQDQWQITLGHIAEGKTLSGQLLKGTLEGLVKIASLVDNILPLLGFVAGGKLVKGTFNGIINMANKANGSTAIKNMQIAKEQEANRLLRERLMYGKQLTQEERKIVAERGKLTSQDYYLLATERQITAQKAHQLMLDGKMSKEHFYRLLQMQGYTREQRKQIANGNLQSLKGGGFGSKALGFMGGWFGVAMAATGAIASLYSNAKDKINEAKDAAKGANEEIFANLKNANALFNDLSTNLPTKTEDITSAIGNMSNTLKETGNYTDELQEKLNGITDEREKYNLLYAELQKVSNEYLVMKENVEAYLEAANRVGEGNWFTKLFSDPMSEDLKDLSKANIDKKVAKAQADRLSAEIKTNLEEYLKSVGKWQDSFSNDTWEKLYEKLSEKEKSGFYGTIESNAHLSVGNAKKYWQELYDAVDAYQDALDKVSDKEAEVDGQMQESANYWHMALEERASLNRLDIDDITSWKEDDLRKFNGWLNDIVGGLKLDSETSKKVKDAILATFPKEAVVKIRALKPVGTEDLSPWQEEIKQYFESHKINIPITAQSSLEKIEKDLQTKRKEFQEQMDRSGAVLISVGLDLSKLPKNFNEIKDQIPFWMRNFVEKNFNDYNEGKEGTSKIDEAGKDTGLRVDNTKNTTKGSKTDTQLKKWQERKKALDEYYKLYQEYSKYMKHDEAIALINKTGLIKGQALPKNIDDYLQVLKDFQAGISKGSINTTERQSFWDSLTADVNRKDFEQGSKKTADALLKQLDEELKTRGKQWNLYEKVLEATGDKSQAAQMAFGGGIRFDNYAQELRDRISKKLEDMPKAKAVGIDKLLGMDEESLAGLGIFERSDIIPMLKELKDIEQQLNEEDANLFLDAVKNAKSLEEELNRIAVKYDRARKAIKENGNLTPERKQELTENLDNEQARANADKRWEYFKKNEEWGRVFTNLDKMSTQTLRNMRDELVRTLPDISDSVEATKALYEALEKIDKVANQRNPFKTLSDAVRKYNAIDALLGKGGLSSLGFRNENGTYTVGTNNLGVKPGTYTRAQLKDLQKASGTEFNEGMQGLSSKFKMLQDSLNPVIDLFNALGQTKAAEFLQAGSNALGAASQMGMGAVAAFGASAGPWGAAIGAALSLTTSIIGMHDKALQKEIDASKARQKEMETLSKNMEKVLERVLGGVYNYRNSEESIRQTTRFSEEVRRYIDMDKRAKKAQEELTELEKRSGGKNIAVLSDSYRMTKWRLERDIKNSYVKADTLQAIDHAEKTLEYYDQQRASLMIQRDEAEHQLAKVEERKGDHKQEIDDYRQQITELDDQLVHFALDMAKALYDIDIKSWAQQLTDAVVSAWDSGADAAEAYSKKVKSLVKDLTKNILAQRVVEQMFDNSGINKLIAGMMDMESGKLNMKNVEAIADILFNIGENASNAITAVLDEEERRGYIERGEGSSSSKLIQGGFTENETGLLLSYVNAIRGDVSVQRTDVNAIRLSVEMMAGRQGIIAEAQTRHLEQIAANTMRNADAAEAIQSLLRRATQDKSFGFHIQ